jgi:nitroreductase
MAAPTAMDKRPWVFVAVTKRENLDKLADGLSYAQMLKQASAAILVCGDTTKTIGEFWKMDCSAASENLLLAVEATGLGAVWTAVYPDPAKINHVRDILGLPQTIIPLNCIPIGYPTGIEKPKDKWNPANIHWEKW